MATHAYKVEGKKVPSVTTVLGRFKAADGLIFWAWDLGMQGKDYRQERQKAADSGTVAHQMVEAHLHGKAWEPDGAVSKEILDPAKRAFEAFLRWSEGERLDILHTEVPLVSSTHKFGGCLDAVGMCQTTKGRVLYDWKSSNKIYPDHLYQLAAYAILWNENYPDDPITGGAHLCRFPKDGGDFSHYYFDELEKEKQVFLHMRQLYDMIKPTEARLRT